MKKNYRRFVLNLSLLLLTASLSAVATSHAATVKPVLTITSPKAGQRLSNDVFTVTGTATSKNGLTNVLYSLDNATWTNADNNNNWTNWSVQVTLNPGTNTFSACAVDTNGLHSMTNTVKFIYVMKTTLTVLANGNLIIKPNYNGAQLQINNNYSMTATAGKGTANGFGFRNWTDGSNNIITTSTTLKFTMVSNLTFIANFGNILRPTISVKSTTTNADGVLNDFVVHGTTTDKAGVTNVFYQLNKGGWQTATTTNNWTNWNASVSLQPGLNTFSAYAVNVNSNSSVVVTAQITYNSAALSLLGKFAEVTDLGGNSLSALAFSKTTFSQVAQDGSDVNGVGTYTYSGSGNNGSLKIKYVNPPSAAKKGSQTIGLFFYTPNYAYFTNITAKNSGSIQFSPAQNLAISNIAGQIVWSVGSQTNANGIFFQKTNYSSQSLLTADTNGGSYSYTKYSPLGSLFKLINTNGTSYIQASFAGTNYGSYYEEDYDSSGHTNGIDYGNFVVASETLGGNAPLTVTNRNFEIFSGGDSFNVQFGADTYSQDTLSANFDNDVGDYTYDRPDTNIGQFNLTVTAPPADGTNANDVLAGNTNAARMIFVGGNVGLFTNDDGTISTFVMTSVTNLVPALITTNTLNLSYNFFFANQFQFDTNGNFSFNSTNNTPSGTYTYTPFSPTVAMLQFNFITNGVGTNGTELDWVRLNFSTTNSGSYFTSQFDTDTNFLGNFNGTFSIY